MKNDLTEIAFVLDRSGSMGSVAAETITGFNEFLLQQQQPPGKARMTLVLFDDEFILPVDHLPVEEVFPLNSDTYQPRNSTALLDAIGLTIDRIGDRLSKTEEAARPEKVIVAVLTDGMENASQKAPDPFGGCIQVEESQYGSVCGLERSDPLDCRPKDFQC